MVFNHIYREVRFFLQSLNFYRLFNIVLVMGGYWISIITRKTIVEGLPYSCSIEPATFCNLKCPECPAGMNILTREKGFLSLENYCNWIHKIKKHTFYLTLYLQGEPLLNKNLPAMIAYASKNKIFTTISTNAQLLGKELAYQLVLAGLKKIIISMDGIDQETYEFYRRKGKLDKVIDGINNVVLARKRTGRANPLIVLQFIVFGHNENQIPEIKKVAKALGADKLELKTAQHYNLTKENSLITSLEKYRRYRLNAEGNWTLKAPLKNKCIRLWSTSVITWNGLLIPCCYDKDATYSMGNLNEQEFSKIWKGEKFKCFREQILKSKKSIGICRNCGG